MSFNFVSKRMPALGAVCLGASVLFFADWGYHDPVGPKDWCKLSPKWALCCKGKQQSPINIDNKTVKKGNLPKLQFFYSPFTFYGSVNNGHTVQANTVTQFPWSVFFGGHLLVGNKLFTLQQFHFHTESEHTVDGKFAPIEMHLVHKGFDGSLLVVGVMLKEGAANSALQQLWDAMPDKKGKQAFHWFVSLLDLLPKTHTSYRYAGSLTTPPCSEKVSWVVMTEPLTMSKAQIAKFKTLFSGHDFPHGNRRPVQALNGRTVTTDKK